MEQLVPILGVIFSLSIPMVVMYFVAKMVINEKNRDKEIRQLIIEHDMDAERAKLLIKEKRDNSSRYPSGSRRAIPCRHSRSIFSSARSMDLTPNGSTNVRSVITTGRFGLPL